STSSRSGRTSASSRSPSASRRSARRSPSCSTPHRPLRPRNREPRAALRYPARPPLRPRPGPATATEDDLSRAEDRTDTAPRPIRFERAFTDHPAGSVLVTAGRTRILCTVSVQEGVPQWMVGHGKAWLTAEYSMLPGSTRGRKVRDRLGRIDARSLEIQRLIGRALRALLDTRAMPEITLWVDCDVLSADGGTRTTAINGSCVALHDALKSLEAAGRLRSWPMNGL